MLFLGKNSYLKVEASGVIFTNNKLSKTSREGGYHAWIKAPDSLFGQTVNYKESYNLVIFSPQF